MIIRHKIKERYLGLMINGCDEPWDSQSQKDVYTITSSYVADTCISILLVHSSSFGSEQIGKTCSKGDECDGLYFFLQSNETAEYSSQITNHSGHNTDHSEDNNERDPTTGPSTGWYKCKQNLRRKKNHNKL